jgi:predicted XRE-type DNA-binding protein
MDRKLARRTGPKPLTQRMQEIVEYAFNNPTSTQRQIAEHFGVSEQRISHVMKSDRVLAAFPVFAKRRLKAMVPMAVEKLGQLMNQKENLEVSRKVVERVLDTEKVLENHPTTQINVFQTMSSDDLMRKVEQITVAHGEVVDTDIVEGPDPT